MTPRAPPQRPRPAGATCDWAPEDCADCAETGVAIADAPIATTSASGSVPCALTAGREPASAHTAPTVTRRTTDVDRDGTAALSCVMKSEGAASYHAAPRSSVRVSWPPGIEPGTP